MRRVLFLLTTAVLSGLFVFALWKDQIREWTGYQQRFFHSLSKDERRGMTGGIKQIIVSDLGRVDRCTTCHLAIDKPAMALGAEPFTAHPGEFLKWHPPEQFGCTVCHGGQGLATEVEAAHGHIEHWERPLLTGPMVQASCAKCHGDLPPIEAHVPKLMEGQALYRRHGCAGCHTINGFGQTVSVDLSDMADKPWQLLDFTFVEGGHGLVQWLDEHFKEPRAITPGFRKDELPAGEEEVYPTFMPNYGLTDDESKALTVYMLSLTAESLPAKYVRQSTGEAAEPVGATPVERGRQAFVKFGCIGCHGQNGMGGRKNFNAQMGQEVPSLVRVALYYDREAVKELIRHGRQPVPRIDGTRPNPPVFMPAWKGRISEDEIDDIASYLFSLAEQLPQAPDAAAAPAEQPQ